MMLSSLLSGPRKTVNNNSKENKEECPEDKRRRLLGSKEIDRRAMTQIKAGSKPLWSPAKKANSFWHSPERKTVPSPPKKASEPASPAKTVQQESAVTMNREPEPPLVLVDIDVEALLAVKLNGKSKFDYKGRCEMMGDYIKKLRACLRLYREAETQFLSEKEDFMQQLQMEAVARQKLEETFLFKLDEHDAEMADIKCRYEDLEKELRDARSQNEGLLVTVETSQSALEDEKQKVVLLEEGLAKAKKENGDLSQQVSSLMDVNKRLQEYNTSLQQYNSKLQSDAVAAGEAITRLSNEKNVIIESLTTVRGNFAIVQDQLDSSKNLLADKVKANKELQEEGERLKSEILRLTKERDLYTSQIDKLSEENLKTKESRVMLEKEFEQLSVKANAMEEAYNAQIDSLSSVRSQLDFTQQKLKMAEARVTEKEYRGDEAKEKLIEVQQKLVEAENRLHEGELVRRKLHNTILELKGNVRVFCRVRPLVAEEEEGAGSFSAVHYPTSAELAGRGVELVQSQGLKHSFVFDKVFGPDVRQDDVFVEVSQLVQSALDGYKVCIFAYGQTGSGKTHTMLGNDRPDLRGIIPRSLEQIFKTSQDLSSTGWTFRLKASMLEIYNDSIRDLLARPGHGNDKQHVIKHDAHGNTIVTDLTIVDVCNWKEVACLLQRATETRSVGKTAMNEVSSRSHCVFTLRISGANESTDQHVEGVLNLIDLAGSERLSRSASTGDRLKETQAINKSLSALGDVIQSIGNKDAHVPYRNSKLTYLLQPYLGGESKTLMVVNVAPEMKSVTESLCSLRFAAKINACEIGIPRRHIVGNRDSSRLSSS